MTKRDRTQYLASQQPIRDESNQIASFQQLLDDTMQQLGYAPARGATVERATSPFPAALSVGQTAPKRAWAAWLQALDANISPTAMATMIGTLLATLLITIVSVTTGITVPTSAAAPTEAPVIIIATATMAPPTPKALPTVQAYAAPNGTKLGEIPADSAAAYQDSRNPGWAGVEWEGQIVWVRTDADTSSLRDLAPPPTQKAAKEPHLIVVTQTCYTSTLNVYDARGYHIGIAEGHSCESQEAANANAENEAIAVRASEAAQATVRSVCAAANLVTVERDVFYRDTIIGHITGRGCDLSTAETDADEQETELLRARAQN
jgi:hypothetical protein